MFLDLDITAWTAIVAACTLLLALVTVAAVVMTSRMATPTPEDWENPIIRFVDWHGNRYYQYRHYTNRFKQNTEWLEAAETIDLWIRTGPNPD